MTMTYALEEIQFEWDDEKARNNWEKHGVSFETACEVFFDPFITVLELQEVDSELRDVSIGMTSTWQVLYVVHTVKTDERIRLISARRATRMERNHYENQ
jgi:uncharacterized protein